jgi:Flp pilus assembly protein TadG
MRTRRGTWRSLARALSRHDSGAAVVEFALVVPLLFLLVWAGLNFSRAYQRLNVLTGSLREGARYGATLPAAAFSQATVRTRVSSYSTSFGFPIDVNQVTVTLSGSPQSVTVSVTNYPLFANLTGFSGLSSVTVTRSAVFRYEW